MEHLKKRVGGISYTAVCGWLICFNLLDMLSTDLVLFHGSRGAIETNALAASLQGSHRIAILRVATIVVLAAALYFSRIPMTALTALKRLSARQFLLCKTGRIPRAVNVRISVFMICAILSVTRLLAALSNASGEVFGLSVPTVVSRLTGLTSLNAINMVSIILLTLGAIGPISAFWEIFRRAEAPPPVLTPRRD